jgi:hypothetical protein
VIAVDIFTFTISFLISVGAGVVGNYLYDGIGKWLNGNKKQNKKAVSTKERPRRSQLRGRSICDPNGTLIPFRDNYTTYIYFFQAIKNYSAGKANKKPFQLLSKRLLVAEAGFEPTTFGL